MLIHKIDNPICFNDFRPISLCNIVNKIITKVIVHKLCPFLEEIISPLQGSFVLVRGATNNAIIAQKLIHFIHLSKAKKGRAFIKIDLEKAYDKASWDYLEKVLHDFCFPQNIIFLVIWCTKSSLSMVWNGSQIEYFKPSRGLRQGYHLSSYPFVICMEKLSLCVCVCIQQLVDDGIWEQFVLIEAG